MTVQRYYGSMGDIQVFGMATVVANTSVSVDQEAAMESVDFTASLVQVTIPDGSTSGTLSVPVIDNQESGPLKVFQFILTSVAGSKYTQSYLKRPKSWLNFARAQACCTYRCDYLTLRVLPIILAREISTTCRLCQITPAVYNRWKSNSSADHH